MARIPSQNWGAPRPMVEMNVMMLSMSLPRRTALMMPNMMPRTLAIIRAGRPMEMVRGSRSKMQSAAGR